MINAGTTTSASNPALLQQPNKPLIPWVTFESSLRLVEASRNGQAVKRWDDVETVRHVLFYLEHLASIWLEIQESSLEY